MDFKPGISPDLKKMPEEIFYPVWGKLKQHIGRRKEEPIAAPDPQGEREWADRYGLDLDATAPESPEEVPV